MQGEQYNATFIICRRLTLFVQESETGSGYKFHATNRANTAPWRYEYAEWRGPESITCVTLTPIGKIPDWGVKSDEECIAALDRVLRQVPIAVSSVDSHDFSTFTCRAWFRAAIRQLNHHRYVSCPDVVALETRLKNTAIGIHSQGNKDPRFLRPLVWPDYAPSVSLIIPVRSVLAATDQ